MVARKEVMGHDKIGTVCTAGRDATNLSGDCQRNCKTYFLWIYAEFGKGFDKSNLRKMRQFYCTFPIRDTLCLELGWSHYRLLMHIPDEQARTFYMEECVKSAWSVRQLEWQINTMYYQRMNKSNRVSEFSRHPVTLSHNRRCHSLHLLYR